MVEYMPVLVCLVGLLIFVFAKDAKPQEIGKSMFWVGLFVFLFQFSSSAIRFIR